MFDRSIAHRCKADQDLASDQSECNLRHVNSVQEGVCHGFKFDRWSATVNVLQVRLRI